MKRRDFLKTSALAAAGVGVSTLASACSKPGEKAEFTEGGSADIIVAGGGPAGISAAITASRLGKSVLLLEAGGCLGGVWTRSVMPCVMDFGRSDIAKEIISRLDSFGARIPRWASMRDNHFLFDHEIMKYVLEQMCLEAGVRIILNCPVVAVGKKGRTIESVFTESKSGRQRWTAKAFFDTTGDGSLAVKAGCGFDFGGESEGDNDQPASFQGIVIIDDDEKIAEFINNDPSAFGPDVKQKGSRKAHFREYVKSLGSEAPAPNLVRLHKNILAFSCGFEYGVRVDDAESQTKAVMSGRKEMFDLIDTLTKKGGERWSGMRLIDASDQIGQRASRRIHGRYTITNDDIINGATFEDAVAGSRSIIDIHATKKGEGYLVDPGIKAKPFQIPFRSCQARDVDNLFLAGKCISGGFYPLASYRMTGPATEMGENVARKVCELLG